MVAGDLVNTAARIQSAAEPGTVLVGEATKRATEAAIAYEDAGAHELKGKAEPVAALARAARRRRARRGAPVDGPRAAVRRPRPRAAPRQGALPRVAPRSGRRTSSRSSASPGIGKSRLAWEFEKYIDGLVEDVWWHRGRCLAYGEGVAYWALAEMVRMRGADRRGGGAGRRRSRSSAPALERARRRRRRARVARAAARPPARPRASAPARDRQDLFSAWRLFFERLADAGRRACSSSRTSSGPTPACSTSSSTCSSGRATIRSSCSRSRGPSCSSAARPGRRLAQLRRRSALEPLSRRGDGGAARRPRARAARTTCARDILDRAEGVPLYAVETVRMLLDRGLLAREGDGTGSTGPIEALEVPETLHALIAARLDGLAPEERSLAPGRRGARQDVHAAGRRGARRARPRPRLEPLLAALVRKEVLVAPGRPALARARPVRLPPGPAQARRLRDALASASASAPPRRGRPPGDARWADEDEIAEVVASHYLDAYGRTPDADDAPEIKQQARDALDAGRRARRVARRDGRGGTGVRRRRRPGGRAARGGRTAHASR